MSEQATTYAEALIQSALEGWLEQLTTVQRSLRRSPELAAVLGDPNALPTDRESAIGRLLPATTAPEVARFVRLLAQRGDMNLLSAIVAHVREVVPALSHDEDAEVTSAMARHLQASRLTTVVVGDYEAVGSELGQLGLGEPVVLPPDTF